ncbi:cysteine-rich protein [Aconite virus A]|uniref:RNA silencing suppressor n=1 Tax=Aconite virus A TaxID=2764701 RepID=A0A8K1DR73_9VIRU|nr:cysteine-rich protein [Aconite virus A]QNJ34492.1 cysteine-rich protein [Aconite virus A]
MNKIKIIKRLLVSAFKQKVTRVDYDVVNYISSLCVLGKPGRSSYARKRRAKQLARCPRCYRMDFPLSPLSRCDGIHCVPGLSYNSNIARKIMGLKKM